MVMEGDEWRIFNISQYIYIERDICVCAREGEMILVTLNNLADVD
jgi:hypothetical protein